MHRLATPIKSAGINVDKDDVVHLLPTHPRDGSLPAAGAYCERAAAHQVAS